MRAVTHKQLMVRDDVVITRVKGILCHSQLELLLRPLPALPLTLDAAWTQAFETLCVFKKRLAWLSERQFG